MAGRKHPGNPAKVPDDHYVHAAAIAAFQRKCREGLICWFCTDDAVATLVKPSREPVFRDGQWGREMVHRPVCGPGYCVYGYGP